MNIIKKLLIEIRNKNRKRILAQYRQMNNNKDVSIIAQNCVGGVMYSALDLEFKSPTVNLFIEDENFVKLVENLEYYMSIPAVPKSEKYVDPIDSNIVYPKIAVDDIEICCLHYHSCSDAIEAWERRRKRVNLNNVYVIANSWNLHDNENYIERLCHTKYKTIIFTLKEYPFKECIKLKGKKWKLDNRGIVRPNLTDNMGISGYKYYEKQFDFISWLNS